jgi:hypothetical protein
MLALRILALHSPVSMLHIWRDYTVFGHIHNPSATPRWARLAQAFLDQATES